MYIRQPVKKKTKYPLILAGAFIALFLTLLAVKGSFPSAVSSVSKTILSVFEPVFWAKNSVVSFTRKIGAIFADGLALKEENVFLKGRVSELESENSLAKEIIKENKILNEVLGENFLSESLINAYILARPRYGIYDGLIIDTGTGGGVEDGDIVTAFGTVFLGRVYEAADSISKVKLISYPGEETGVFVGGRFAALAKGTGGANLEIIAPKDVEIFVGDGVVLSGGRPLFLGIIEKVEKEPSVPIQKALFRLPVNLNEIDRVFILTK